MPTYIVTRCTNLLAFSLILRGYELLGLSETTNYGHAASGPIGATRWASEASGAQRDDSSYEIHLVYSSR